MVLDVLNRLVRLGSVVGITREDVRHFLLLREGGKKLKLLETAIELVLVALLVVGLVVLDIDLYSHAAVLFRVVSREKDVFVHSGIRGDWYFAKHIPVISG